MPDDIAVTTPHSVGRGTRVHLKQEDQGFQSHEMVVASFINDHSDRFLMASSLFCCQRITPESSAPLNQTL